jgi:hypothetical protein
VEPRLGVFENRVLRSVFRPKRDEVTGKGENYIMSSLMISTTYLILSGGKIEKNEMGRACGTNGREELCTGFWWGSLREKDHLGEPSSDGRIILRWIFTKWEGLCGWMELAQDRDRWRALVTKVMNFRVQQMRGIS